MLFLIHLVFIDDNPGDCVSVKKTNDGVVIDTCRPFENK